jgi:polysaccharide chain length determinant protein (PEP-CTERM system associated)
MVRNGEIAVSDVKRIVRRYWWIPTFLTLVTCAIGLAATMVLPKKYTSTTLVLVQPPTVPGELIKPVVTDNLYQRMASMKAQILSRSRLEMIITKFNLYPQERGTAHMEDLVEKLKSTVTVELIQPMAGTFGNQPPGFNVSVTFGDPHLAQQICQEITSMFMEQNATARVTQSNKTTQFLTEQLEEAKAKLDEQDKQLAQFKAEHPISMPDQEQGNLALLSTMNTQLDAATQAITHAQQDKSLNETLLTQQEANWKATQVGQQNPETQEQELSNLQAQLAALLSKYTPEHPDVIKLQSQIADLKRRMAETPEAKAPAASASAQAALREPPSLQQLRIKIKQDDFAIADLTKRQAQIQGQIHAVQGRLQASPLIEQQLKDLTRNYQTASEIYNELLKKREDSAMATDLEHEQQGENFKVLDAPSLPSSPSFPKPLIFIGGGLGAGLALSLAILYLLAMSDKAMYSERDVEVCLKLPVLASVPTFDVRAAGNGWKGKTAVKYDGALVGKA